MDRTLYWNHMSVMTSQIIGNSIVCSTGIQTKIKENIKAPHYWPIVREFTSDQRFPSQRASNVENISMPWNR